MVKRTYDTEGLEGSSVSSREKTKKAIEAIHQYKPKYIFLADTGSVTAGAVLKDALKKAYPAEPLPKFYRIDPRQVINVLEAGNDINLHNESGYDPTKPAHEKKKDVKFFETKKGELEEFFRKRIRDKSAPILVYDQDWNMGWSPGSIVSLLKHPEKYGLDPSIKCDQVKMNNSQDAPPSQDFYRRKAAQTLEIDSSDILPESTLSTAIASSRFTTKKDERGGYNFRGRIGRSGKISGYNLSNLDALRAYKQLGREVGQEIHTELERKKKLEHIVSVVLAISGLSSGLFFFGSNITGNVIGNMSRSSVSLIGTGLFLFGIVGVFIYFKTKKE